MTKILMVKCPRCRKEVAYEGNPYRPFCSDRCQLIDLGNWADGKYAVPDNHSEPDLLSEGSESDGSDNPDESA